MEIRKEVLDELVRDYKNLEDLLGDNGLLKQIRKGLLERARAAELKHELGFAKMTKAFSKKPPIGVMEQAKKQFAPSTARFNWRYRATSNRSSSR